MNTIDFKNLIKRTKKLKVLYVEDNKESRTQVVKTLDNFFSYIDVATNGLEGLNQYKLKEKKFYDLIISDINMPKMNGIDMIKAILEINNNQNVLVVTAHNNSQYLQELINLSVKNYIHKPININSLTNELLKIVDTIEIEDKNDKKDKDFINIKKLNHELDALVDSFDNYVIASRTDLRGKITYASKAYEIISGYSEKELLGKPHSIVRHPDMPSSAFKDMWDTIQSKKLWIGEVKNLKKDGSFYWVEAHIAPYYNGQGEHIGYSAIRLDITSNKKVEKLNNEITNLLNHAGQGFLSFGKNLKIDESFSKECLNIFNTIDIFEQDIANILFYNNQVKQNLLKDGIDRILKTDEIMIKEIFLSLLPKEHIINNKDIKIEYKLLPNDKFMMVLTDITNTKILESKIKEQNQIQNMIIAVASNKQDFLEIKHDFESFISNIPNDLTVLLRELHTFKGLFAQKEMLNIVPAIHTLETKINKSQKYDKDYNLKDIFQLDLNIISSILGANFLKANYPICIDKSSLAILESKLQKVNSKNIEESLSDIFYDIEKFKYESIYDMLNNYISTVKIMAQKLKKEIYPIEINGDKELKIDTKYKPFIKSLIHLFNNCVEHGIENIEIRSKRKKDEIGTILCSYTKTDDNLQIIISDDGAGINIEKITNSAIKKSIKTKQEIHNMNDEEKINLIFADKLTTNEKILISSGRGIGMSAILSEVKKLDGNIKIDTDIGKGVKFTFTLPLKL